MNRFVKDMLMSRYSRDKSSDYARRDYRYDSAGYDMRESDYARRQSDYAMRDRHYEYPIQHPDYRDYAMRRERDYYDGHDVEYGKMTREDLEHWKKSLQNSDGSHGEHFRKEQVEQAARNMGINIAHYGNPDVFTMAVNMAYADYCAVAKKYGIDRIEYYIDHAKAFLMDKDFKGKPEEKLWLYYKCIAEQED